MSARLPSATLHLDAEVFHDTPCQVSPDPDAWFPDGASDLTAPRHQRAIAACEACPVLKACRARTKKIRPSDGIWGGIYRDPKQSIRMQQAVRARQDKVVRILAEAGAAGDGTAAITRERLGALTDSTVMQVERALEVLIRDGRVVQVWKGRGRLPSRYRVVPEGGGGVSSAA